MKIAVAALLHFAVASNEEDHGMLQVHGQEGTLEEDMPLCMASQHKFAFALRAKVIQGIKMQVGKFKLDHPKRTKQFCRLVSGCDNAELPLPKKAFLVLLCGAKPGLFDDKLNEKRCGKAVARLEKKIEQIKAGLPDLVCERKKKLDDETKKQLFGFCTTLAKCTLKNQEEVKGLAAAFPLKAAFLREICSPCAAARCQAQPIREQVAANLADTIEAGDQKARAVFCGLVAKCGADNIEELEGTDKGRFLDMLCPDLDPTDEEVPEVCEKARGIVAARIGEVLPKIPGLVKQKMAQLLEANPDGFEKNRKELCIKGKLCQFTYEKFKNVDTAEVFPVKVAVLNAICAGP